MEKKKVNVKMWKREISVDMFDYVLEVKRRRKEQC